MKRLTEFSPVKKYQQMSTPMRAALWFTFCNYLQRSISIITVPIFTRLLTTEQYGVYSVYLSWFEIFLLFLTLKLPYEGLNNGMIRYEKDKDGYVSSISVLMTVITAIGFCVYLIFRKQIDQITGLSTFLMVLMFIEILFHPPLAVWTNRKRFDFEYRGPVIVTAISAILNPIIAVVAVLNTSYKAEARVIATVAVQAVCGIVCYVLLLYRGRTGFQKEYWRFALSFNLPLIFFYLSQSLLSQCDRIMINYFCGTAEAGIYTVAYSAATLVQLAVAAVNATLHPWLCKKLKAKQYGDINGVALPASGILALATLAMTAFAPDLVRLLATAEYTEAFLIIPPVAASVYFIFVYCTFADVEMYYGENRYTAVVSIIAAVFNVALNYLCIPRFGYLAAGYTTLASYVLLAVMHYLLMRRTCRKHQVTHPIFDGRSFLLLSVVLLAASGSMLILYQFGFVRYVVIAAEALALWCLRKRIAAMIEKVKQEKETS